MTPSMAMATTLGEFLRTNGRLECMPENRNTVDGQNRVDPGIYMLHNFVESQNTSWCLEFIGW